MKFKLDAAKAANIVPNLVKRGGGLPLLPRDGGYVGKITSWSKSTQKGNGGYANDFTFEITEAPDNVDPAQCIGVSLTGTFWHEIGKFDNSPEPAEVALKMVMAALPQDQVDQAIKELAAGTFDMEVWGPKLVGHTVGGSIRTVLGENKKDNSRYVVSNVTEIGSAESARNIGTAPYNQKVSEFIALREKFAAAGGAPTFGVSNGAATAIAAQTVTSDALSAALDG